MSNRFEESIQDWYKHSRTTNLEYLHLESSNTLVSKHHISHNLDCTFDRVSILAKVCLKNFHQILEKQEELSSQISNLSTDLQSLKKDLGRLEIELTSEIPLSEKLIRTTLTETAKEVQQVHHLVAEGKRSVYLRPGGISRRTNATAWKGVH